MSSFTCCGGPVAAAGPVVFHSVLLHRGRPVPKVPITATLMPDMSGETRDAKDLRHYQQSHGPAGLATTVGEHRWQQCTPGNQSLRLTR